MLDGRAVPVLTGPSRGNRIVVGSGAHGYWIGHFERWKQQLIAGLLEEGDVLYDLGAHAGFFTLLGAKLVGRSGMVVSVEPVPANIARLRAHIRVNGYESIVRIIEAAVTDATGEARFTSHDNTFMGHVDEAGDAVVATVALDDLELVPPTLVKMDIEGGEPKALRGMHNLVVAGRPTLVISPHGTDQEVRALLDGWGYTVKLHRGDLIAWPGDRPSPMKGSKA